MTKNRQITLSLQGFTVPELSMFIIVPLIILAALIILVVYRTKIWPSKKAKTALKTSPSFSYASTRP
jgi:predicted membrane-bound mannosyltransferase